MKGLKSFAVLLTVCAATCAHASWYWPFGRGADGTNSVARLSELMEPASTNIDAAADFAAEGKYKEAQDCYRAAIAALKKIEEENPERAATPEFATVRNKRAYINAALDSMLLAEARDNAKAVAVTDTTELEVTLTLKPWKEFLPTYESLTNADRLVTKRLALVESPWAGELMKAAEADERLRIACATNRAAVGQRAAAYAEQRDALAEAFKSASSAVERLERVAETASAPGGARVFDVCKKDVRTGVKACQDIWPKCGEALDKLALTLEGLRRVMLEVGAKEDFPAIAADYVAENGRNLESVQEMAQDIGYLNACELMLGELDAAAAGIVHRGILYKLHAAWGGEEADVPTKEEDRGLVENEGDSRPDVTSQIDDFMEKERKHNERVTKVAERSKARKDVQREVDRLLRKDPQSRKARLLMAGEDLRSGDTAAAMEKVKVLLDEKPNDAPALNMRAAIEAADGDLKAAQRTLDQAIQSNPRDYHAYYNMANVYIERGNVDGARRYYETGRSFAGPRDEAIERAVTHR